MILAVDTETTGIDLKYGCSPFYVTTCDTEGEQHFWEWDVDPLTRKPIVPKKDLKEVRDIIRSADKLVFQNAKFDLYALSLLGLEPKEGWNWENIHDTLLSGHLLCSNQPHDLTTMAMIYLNINLKPYEVKLHAAVTEARRIAKKQYPEWRTAKAGLPEMPSAKDKVTGYDYWLPRAIAQAEGYDSDHKFWTVLSAYSNLDPAATIGIHQAHEELMERGDLSLIYAERMKILRVVYLMETNGITLNKSRLSNLQKEYRKESSNSAQTCLSIAKKLKYDLVLPKGANNNSLLHFCFGEPVYKVEVDPKTKKKTKKVINTIHHLKLPTVGKTKTGNPSLDAKALEKYKFELPEGSPQHTFVSAIRSKRQRDTAVSYMLGYERFWKLAEPDLKSNLDWYKLFPSLNPTGTNTLRFSSNNPNEQNISKKEGFNIRYCFGPLPGREWWSLDYENIELRIPAYEAQEQEMIDLFEKPDEPPYFGSNHLLVAHTLWEKEFDECLRKGLEFKKEYKSTLYQWTKNGNFAVQYGAMEESGTADAAYHQKGAQRRIQSRFQQIAKLNTTMIEHAERYGYVETMPDLTVDASRGYPLFCTRTKWGGVLKTVPLNYHIQGTAMWCTMKAMIRIQEQLDEWNQAEPGSNYKLVMQVHDEVVLDFPKRGKANKPKIRKIKQLMEESGNDINIPLRVSVSYHPNNWSEESKL